MVVRRLFWGEAIESQSISWVSRPRREPRLHMTALSPLDKYLYLLVRNRFTLPFPTLPHWAATWDLLRIPPACVSILMAALTIPVAMVCVLMRLPPFSDFRACVMMDGLISTELVPILTLVTQRNLTHLAGPTLTMARVLMWLLPELDMLAIAKARRKLAILFPLALRSTARH